MPLQEIAKKKRINYLVAVCYCVLLILTVVLYLPVINAPFIHWDDYLYIVDNDIIKEGSIRDILWGYAGYGGNRLNVLTIFIMYKAFGPSPQAYHLLNLGFHIFNIILVYHCTKALIRHNNKWLPLGLAALFALHPLQAEAVCWISGRKDILLTSFYLLSVLTYHKYTRGKSMVGYILSFCFFCIAIGFKISAAALPLVLLLYHYLKKDKISIKQMAALTPFFIVVGWFLIKLLFLSPNTGLQETYSPSCEGMHFNFFQRILMACYSLLFYSSGISMPFNLHALYPYPDPNSGLSLLYYLSPVLLLISLFFLYKVIKTLNPRLKRQSLGALGFFVINILIYLHMIPIKGLVIAADRYTYLAGTGIMLFWILLWMFWVENSKKGLRVFLYFTALIYFIVLSFQTYKRIGLWRDGRTISQEILEYHPECAKAWSILGLENAERGNTEEAIGYFSKAILFGDSSASTFYNRGLAFEKNNSYSQAIEDFTKAIEKDPFKASFFNNRGYTYDLMGEFPDAMTDYDHALRLEPADNAALLNKANLLLKQGLLSEAISLYDTLIRKQDPQAVYYCNRAIALYKNAMTAEAKKSLQKALDIDPRHQNSLYNFGMILYESEYYHKALEYFKEIKADDPLGKEALNYQGAIHLALGNTTEAIELFSRLIEQAPGRSDYYINRAVCYLNSGDSLRALRDLQYAAKNFRENETALRLLRENFPQK